MKPVIYYKAFSVGTLLSLSLVIVATLIHVLSDGFQLPTHRWVSIIILGGIGFVLGYGIVLRRLGRNNRRDR